jgi:hypothetical protein
MHGLATLQTEFIRSLLNGLTRELNELLDIACGCLEIRARNMKTNGRHFGLESAMTQELTLLSNIQRTAKHTKNRATGSGLNLTKLTIEILEQGMAIPTNRIRQTRLAVEIREGTLRRTLMTLAHKGLILRVLTHRQNTRLPRKGMATMKACRMRILRRMLGLLQNLLHDFR